MFLSLTSAFADGSEASESHRRDWCDENWYCFAYLGAVQEAGG